MRSVKNFMVRTHWKWTCVGIMASFWSFFLIPFNFAILSAYQIWVVWLIFPYGMLCSRSQLPGLLEVMIWLGPPILYGLVLSVAAGKERLRMAFYILLVIHTTAACAAAFR